MKNENCIFCKIARGVDKREKIFESDNFFVMRNDFPLVPGDSLVIPKKHFVTLLDMPNKLGEELIKLIKKTGSSLLDEKFGDGFNVVQNNLEVAGQTVMHLHFHVIPRKDKDGIKILS